MCNITKTGKLKFKTTGKEYEILEDVDYSSLTIEEITELRNTQVSLAEHLELQTQMKHQSKTLHNLRNDLQVIINKVDVVHEETMKGIENLSKELKKHTAGCPVNKNAVFEIIDKEIGEKIGKKIDEIHHVIPAEIPNLVYTDIGEKLKKTSNVIKALLIIIAGMTTLAGFITIIQKMVK